MPDNSETKVPEVTPQPGSRLSLDQAWANISQACAAFNGNLQQHQVIQASLELVNATLTSMSSASKSS